MPTVFITGISGLVGARILLRLLETGCTVRGAVLNPEEEARVRAISALEPYLGHLEIVHVPDMTVPGAYDSHVGDVEIIVHVASPVPFPTHQPDRDIIVPSVRGVENIMSAAKKAKEGRLRKVVVTSSIGAAVPFGTAEQRGRVPRASNTSPATKVPDSMETQSLDPSIAYAVAKAKGLAFIESLYEVSPPPRFDTDVILPGFVLGPDIRASSRTEHIAGSNALMLGPLLASDEESSPPVPVPGSIVDIDDVARVHVAAVQDIRDRGLGLRKFICAKEGDWNQGLQSARDVAREKELGRSRSADAFVTLPVELDIEETEQKFGIRFKDAKETGRGLAEYFFSLPE